jgi:organic radical activating enzyme
MVILGISDICNFNCLFCLDKELKGKGAATLSQINAIFDRIKKSGENTVMFMKGESLIRKDLIQILDLARNKGLKVCLTTNGAMLSSFDFLSQIIDRGVCRLNISIHSHIPKIANAIARVPDCFRLQKKALANIDRYNSIKFMRDRISVRVNVVVCRLNYKTLMGLVTYLKRMLPNTPLSVKFKCMILNKNDLKQSRKLVVPLMELKPYLLKAVACLKHDQFAFSGFPLCIAPGYEWASVELQEQFIHNNIYFDFLTNRANSMKDQVVRKEFFKYNTCVKCNLTKICFGIRSQYTVVFKEFNLNLSKRRPEDIFRVMQHKFSDRCGRYK